MVGRRIWACLVNPAIFPDSAQRWHLFELLRQCQGEGLLRVEDAAALLRDNFAALDVALLDVHAYACLEQFIAQVGCLQVVCMRWVCQPGNPNCCASPRAHLFARARHAQACPASCMARILLQASHRCLHSAGELSAVAMHLMFQHERMGGGVQPDTDERHVMSWQVGLWEEKLEEDAQRTDDFAQEPRAPHYRTRDLNLTGMRLAHQSCDSNWIK